MVISKAYGWKFLFDLSIDLEWSHLGRGDALVASGIKDLPTIETLGS